MRLLEFHNQFPDEFSCRIHFKEFREKEGVVCKSCKGKKHYWLAKKWQWQCANCRFRTCLRAGTIMHKTKISFQYFYQCLAYMSATKKGISATEMTRQLGHHRYNTIWTLMHRVRSSMGQRDAKYKLEGTIEMDEGYLTTSQEIKGKQKRGRGSKTKKNVAVFAESTPLEDVETGKKSSHLRFVKMAILSSHKAENVNTVAKESVSKDSYLITDKSTSYTDFKSLFETHHSHLSNEKTTKETLRWVHITISNAKRNLLGVYHMIKLDYMQNYLNEFCYRLNRRYFGERLFDRLVIAAIFATKPN